ncbi:MAG: sensor histidine kinase, partial [Actinomycetota bacterium]
LLADEGLAAALAAQARKSPVPVTIDADGVGRLPQEIEAAVYFSVLEGMQNTAKYANASHASVTLERVDGALVFVVADDGVGFDAGATSQGSGLQGIADRLGALGGRLDVSSHPGGGTTLRGMVPAADHGSEGSVRRLMPAAPSSEEVSGVSA